MRSVLSSPTPSDLPARSRAPSPGSRCRTDTTTFWIVDAFPSEGERQAHLEGAIFSGLLDHGDRLLDGPPEILQAEVLAAKLPQ